LEVKSNTVIASEAKRSGPRAGETVGTAWVTNTGDDISDKKVKWTYGETCVIK
jgi:hypothetical protein